METAANDGAGKIESLTGHIAGGGDALAKTAAQANERVAAALTELTSAAQGLRQTSDATKAIASALTSESGAVADMTAQLRQTSEQLAQANPNAEIKALMSELKAVADSVTTSAETMRNEIIRFGQQIDEQRLLPAQSAPVALLPAPIGESTRTLADVPKDEVLQRLSNVAAEMHALTQADPQVDELRAALLVAAGEIRDLGNAAETRRLSDELSATLGRHADAIDARAARDTLPSRERLREDLSTMTRELRQVSARAKSGYGAEAAAQVANAAAAIEERARELFEELEDAAGEHEEEEDFVSFESANADVEVLAGFVAKLEARAEVLSEQAAARRLDDDLDVASPAELREKAFAADLRTDSAIQTVFESIERLNNIAAALARAGDAERQRRIIN